MKKMILSLSMILAVMFCLAQDVFNLTIEEWEKKSATDDIYTWNQRRTKDKKLLLIDSLKRNDPNILYTIVPRLNIEDKVFIENRSSFDIIQITVTWFDNKNVSHFLGTLTNLPPGTTKEMAHFRDDDLRQLRRKVLAIKIKGRKQSVMTEEQPEESSIYNYQFKIQLSEEWHDLYIEVLNPENESSMNF